MTSVIKWWRAFRLDGGRLGAHRSFHFKQLPSWRVALMPKLHWVFVLQGSNVPSQCCTIQCSVQCLSALGWKIHKPLDTHIRIWLIARLFQQRHCLAKHLGHPWRESRQNSEPRPRTLVPWIGCLEPYWWFQVLQSGLRMAFMSSKSLVHTGLGR